MTYARHSCSLSSEGSSVCRTFCETGLLFILVIPMDRCHSQMGFRQRERETETERERETQRDYRVIIVIMMLIRSRVFSKERERSVEGIHNCIPVSLLYTSRKILRGWTRIYLIQVMYFTHYSLHQIEVKTKSMAGSMLKWNKNDYEMRSSIWNWFGLISRTR